MNRNEAIEQAVKNAVEKWDATASIGTSTKDYLLMSAIKDALAMPKADANLAPECNPHPDAPHGFLRNASHNEDRYVCECEFWEPYPENTPTDCTTTSTQAMLLNALWQCYVHSGADTDGDTGWHCSPEDAASCAVSAVKELRDDYNEALLEEPPLDQAKRICEQAGLAVLKITEE